MNKEIVIIVKMILVLTLFSCKKDNNKGTENINNEIQTSISKKVEFKFLFNDTVYLNKKYTGEILYKGLLDTISNKVGTKGDVSRFIEYHYRLSNTIDYSVNFLETKIKLDTVSAVSVDTIPFYNIKFTKLGVNYIDGIIDDGAYLANYYEDGKMRVIANRTRATHKVIVIDSTSIIKSKVKESTVGNI